MISREHDIDLGYAMCLADEAMERLANALEGIEDLTVEDVADEAMDILIDTIMVAKGYGRSRPPKPTQEKPNND